MSAANCRHRLAAAIVVVAAVAGAAPHDATAQIRFAPDAFLDPVARQLYTAAFDGWTALDESVVRYTARIDQRIAAAIRAPLRDRVLYHSETAVRTFWERDYDTVVQVLGSRSEYPGRAIAMREGDLDWLEDLPFDGPFEPGNDRLFLGMDDEAFTADTEDNEFALIHPLASGADTIYRFQSGDTMTLSFPDGRRLEAIQLEVLPREAAPQRISGILWIDRDTGALVRAAYRMSREFDAMRDVPDLQEEDAAGTFRFVPGLFKPWTFNLNVVSVDYLLWDFRAWLPRSMRIEGEARAGVLRFPVSMDMAYQVESVVLQEDVEVNEEGDPVVPGDETAPGTVTTARDGMREVHFASRAEAMAFIASLLSEDDRIPYELMDEAETPAADRESLLIVPEDRSLVAESPHLPPPVWDGAPGFTDPDELAEYIGDLADLPAPPVQVIPWNFNWGWARQDLIRYNRVEGPALGGHFDWDLGDRYTLGASGFFGFADLRPKVRLDLDRSNVLRRLTLGAYHELHSVDPQAGHLGFGNSFEALFFGRDNGEYYRATGVDFTWRPPEGRRESFRFRAYAERHAAVERNIDFALFRVFDGDWGFRPNMTADDADELGAEMRISPWWGHDPLKAQFGVEFHGRGATWRPVAGGSGGDGAEARNDYVQASATARAIIPLRGEGWDGWRLGLEAAGGNTWGAAPVQRSWFLGATSTLRGFPASVVSGPSFLRGRVEVNRIFHGVGASLFTDTGWAGEASDFTAGDLLYGIGIGGSILDGLVRLDLSRGLNGPHKGFRLNLYVDGIL